MYKFTYAPEGGSPREWTFDPGNPAWDLAYVTETETGWPWKEFLEKLEGASFLALRALVYAFRKRDEPRLSITAVMPMMNEIDLAEVPEPKSKKAAKGEGEA